MSLSNQQLSLLILNGDLPIFPGRAGHEYLNTTWLAQLNNNVGLVSLLHSHEQIEKRRALEEAGVRLYLWESPYLTHSRPTPLGRWTLRDRVLHRIDKIIRTGLSRPGDSLMQDFQFSNIAAVTTAAMSERHWDAAIVVQSQCARWIDYLPRFPVSVLVLHDVRSLVYERQTQTASTLRERLSYQLEALRYRHWEATYCQTYDLVVTVSKADEEWVRAHYRPKRVVTVPIPVDADYFSPDVTADDDIGQRIVFTGMLNHPPNTDAVCFFAREVFPQVRAAAPNAEFWIVGRDPPPSVEELARLPGVVVTGFVPDIRPYIASATVVVVPLRFGSGMRNKILEAWAMQKCVVSTTIGSEGLTYQDGANLIIADGVEQMSQAVTRVLREPEVRVSLGRVGRAMALSQHDPQQIASEYACRIREAVAEKATADVPMHVALDMHWMIPGAAGGIENLARSFVQHLLTLDRRNHYTALLPNICRYDFDLRGHDNLRIVSKDSPVSTADRLRWRAERALRSRLRLGHWETPEVRGLRFLRSLDAEIVYSFPGYIHPDVYPLRHVLMVPDIQHEFLPEFFSEAALEERRRLYGDSIRRADHLCAISEFTRQTLIERLGVAPEKITTVLLAADPIFKPATDHHADATRLMKYGLETGSYLYFPAHTWHHKNHRAAVTALRILRDKYGLTPQLVCSGGAREAQPDIEHQIEAHGLQGQVRFLGYCPREDLPALYRGAAALIYPSLFEGFGMPVLEAMACGCPVVCSSTTSLPEIAGDAALLCDPLDSEAIADALHRLLRDRELRAELITRGQSQAARFSWRRHTQEAVAAIYRVHRQIHGQ